MKRPYGDSVIAPMTGGRYMVPMSDKGHMVGYDLDHDDPIFLCGRSVRMPKEWWQTSGAADKYGEQYLIADTRETNKCTGCTQGWGRQFDRRKWDESNSRRTMPKDSPITTEEYAEKLGSRWAAEDKQLAMHAAWVAQLLGGEVIENE